MMAARLALETAILFGHEELLSPPDPPWRGVSPRTSSPLVQYHLSTFRAISYHRRQFRSPSLKPRDVTLRPEIAINVLYGTHAGPCVGFFLSSQNAANAIYVVISEWEQLTLAGYGMQVYAKKGGRYPWSEMWDDSQIAMTIFREKYYVFRLVSFAIYLIDYDHPLAAARSIIFIKRLGGASSKLSFRRWGEFARED